MTTRYLKPREVAERWGVTDRQVCRLAQRGDLSALHIGRSVRIPLEAIESYEKSNTRRPGVTPN